MGLFSGMDKFGLGDFKDAQLTEDGAKQESAAELKTNAAPEKKEADLIFDKHYTCPVCDLGFASKCVKAGKVKLLGKDTDLRPIYESMDPNKYDVITCDKCGYSSLGRYFGKLSTRQMRDIRDKVGQSFKGLDTDMDVYSYDDAITRYKLALVCSVVKVAKPSEKGYTCLKMAWVIRGKRLSLNPNDQAVKQLYKDELECLNNAYTCFVNALQNEPLPIAGMDENTLKYIMADLARKLKKYDESIKLLGDVITSRTTSPRLKEEALKLKDLIKDAMKNS